MAFIRWFVLLIQVGKHHGFGLNLVCDFRHCFDHGFRRDFCKSLEKGGKLGLWLWLWLWLGLGHEIGLGGKHGRGYDFWRRAPFRGRIGTDDFLQISKAAGDNPAGLDVPRQQQFGHIGIGAPGHLDAGLDCHDDGGGTTVAEKVTVNRAARRHCRPCLLGRD